MFIAILTFIVKTCNVHELSVKLADLQSPVLCCDNNIVRTL